MTEQRILDGEIVEDEDFLDPELHREGMLQIVVVALFALLFLIFAAGLVYGYVRWTTSAHTARLIDRSRKLELLDGDIPEEQKLEYARERLEIADQLLEENRINQEERLYLVDSKLEGLLTVFSSKLSPENERAEIVQRFQQFVPEALKLNDSKIARKSILTQQAFAVQDLVFAAAAGADSKIRREKLDALKAISELIRADYADDFAAGIKLEDTFRLLELENVQPEAAEFKNYSLRWFRLSENIELNEVAQRYAMQMVGNQDVFDIGGRVFRNSEGALDEVKTYVQKVCDNSGSGEWSFTQALYLLECTASRSENSDVVDQCVAMIEKAIEDQNEKSQLAIGDVLDALKYHRRLVGQRMSIYGSTPRGKPLVEAEFLGKIVVIAFAKPDSFGNNLLEKMQEFEYMDSTKIRFLFVTAGTEDELRNMEAAPELKFATVIEGEAEDCFTRDFHHNFLPYIVVLGPDLVVQKTGVPVREINEYVFDLLE